MSVFADHAYAEDYDRHRPAYIPFANSLMPTSLKSGINATYLLPIVAAYAAVAGLLGLDRYIELQMLLKPVGLAGVAGVAMLALQEIFPRPLKEVIIFWRLRDRPPGCRAFTAIAPKDARIDPTDLAVLIPERPMTPTEQNALWYRWLKASQIDPAIADNHRRFLILRDCAVLILLLALISPAVVSLSSGSVERMLALTAGMFISYLVVAFSARNAAIRLVGNVVAHKVATT